MRVRSAAPVPSIAAVMLAALLTSACSEPPYKEMHQAQGALDAARAAGAEIFANTEYRDAQQALDQSQQAVTQRDYRLALRYALDARERAQDAARAAADHKAEARSRSEHAMLAAEAALRDADVRLEAARAARLKARDVMTARRATENARDTLQKARAAMEKEAYLDVPGMLEPGAGAIDRSVTRFGRAPETPATCSPRQAAALICVGPSVKDCITLAALPSKNGDTSPFSQFPGPPEKR
jgi:hypothetical protein